MHWVSQPGEGDAIPTKADATLKKSHVIPLENTEEKKVFLTSLLRSGAGELVSKAPQVERTGRLALYEDVTDNQGRKEFPAAADG
ncbi:MAG: hypothetical protein ACE5EK_00230 [Nitrospinales bacterium]